MNQGSNQRSLLFPALRRTAVWTCLFALAVSLNLHLVVIQGIGWANMFSHAISESSVEDSLSRTFGGEEPCEFCDVVQEQQERDDTREHLPIFQMSWLPQSAHSVIPPHANRSPHRVDQARWARLPGIGNPAPPG